MFLRNRTDLPELSELESKSNSRNINHPQENVIEYSLSIAESKSPSITDPLIQLLQNLLNDNEIENEIKGLIEEVISKIRSKPLELMRSYINQYPPYCYWLNDRMQNKVNSNNICSEITAMDDLKNIFHRIILLDELKEEIHQDLWDNKGHYDYILVKRNELPGTFKKLRGIVDKHIPIREGNVTDLYHKVYSVFQKVSVKNKTDRDLTVNLFYIKWLNKFGFKVSHFYNQLYFKSNASVKKYLKETTMAVEAPVIQISSKLMSLYNKLLLANKLSDVLSYQLLSAIQFYTSHIEYMKNFYRRISIVDDDEISNKKLIASGSYGVVYSALLYNKKVAVKEIKLQGNEKDKNIIVSFKTEYHLLSQFHSPYIINCIGMNSKEQSFVLEYAEKGALSRLLVNEKESLPWSERLRFSKEIANGLFYLHEKHTYYGDLKSLNVLIVRNHAKLADFGTSIQDQSTNVVSKTLAPNYTPRWTAPELILVNPEGNVQYSRASDIYSYAMVLLELASRQVPWGEKMGANQIIANLIQGNRPSLTPPTIPENCPKRFTELIKFCWDQDPKKRPKAENIVREIKFIMHEESLASKV